MTTHREISRVSISLLALITGGLLAAAPIAAQTVADSSAYGESVSLNVAPLLGNLLQVASGPLPQVSGTASPAYSKTATTASAAVSTALTGNLLQTGILTVHASSQMPAAVLTHADAETDGTAIALGHLIPLLSLNAQVITSSATVDGTCGSSLVATGTANLASAAAGGTVGLGLAIPSHPNPNTVLLNLLGVRIVLNEQIQAGNGTTTRSLTVNAIHVYLQNSLLSGLGLLSGDVVISQSHANVQCPAALPASADLGITGSAAPNPVASGGTLQYHLTVTNQGPDPATGVTLTDALPAGLTVVSATPGQGTCVLGPPVSCNLGTLAPGQSVQVTIAATVTASSGTLVDTATLTSGVADPNPGNNSVTLSTQVTAGTGKSADVALTITAPASGQVGQNLTVVFTVTDNGPDPATSVVLAAAIPERAVISSLTTSQGSCAVASQIVCNLGTLASGGVAKVVLVLDPSSPSTLYCSGTAASSVADPNLANNTASASTLVGSPTTTPPPVVDPGACRIDAEPAATLLFPYFEVDLDRPDGATTLISINNAKAAPQLAQVTLWTDWGIPSMSFTISLTGFAVQTLNLRDILANGVIPIAGGGAGCPNVGVAGVLPVSLVNHLQAWLTGRQSPTDSTCAAPPRATNLATGYITVDAVNTCTAANPTSPGYFVAGGQGIASDQNVLWGDFFLVNPEQNQADGDPAVHILAVPGTFHNHYSFYGTFVGGSGADDRQPLGTSYASRYVSGGVFDGGTHLLVWRDAKVAHPTALACGLEPARMSLAGVIYDETEQAVPLGPSTEMAPWSTQRMQLGTSDFPLPFSFGWVDLDLWHSGSPLFGNVAQGWVTTVMSAQQRFSIGLRAIRLDSACDF